MKLRLQHVGETQKSKGKGVLGRENETCKDPEDKLGLVRGQCGWKMSGIVESNGNVGSLEENQAKS